jgi:hypothetical protein
MNAINIDISDLEIEASEELDFNDQPPTDIVAYNESRSCADLFRLHDSKQLEIQPDFQREVVWSEPDQTRFIDSLIKQLPIPSMCFSLDPKSRRWKVIDGLQRMTAIVRFLGETPWRLSRLKDIDPRISGQVNTDFSGRAELAGLRERVENLSVPVTVIRCDYSRDDHMEFLFSIFRRLNEGGKRLNNQEIRNCIYSGPFNDAVKSLDRDNADWQTIKNRIAGGTDRFRSAELILRFFAMYEEVASYSGSLPRFLNGFMQHYRVASEEAIERFTQLFDRTARFSATQLVPLMGVDERMGYSAWEALLVGVGRNIDALEKANEDTIANHFNRFRSLPALSQNALRGALSGTEKVKNRIKDAIDAFA